MIFICDELSSDNLFIFTHITKDNKNNLLMNSLQEYFLIPVFSPNTISLSVVIHFISSSLQLSVGLVLIRSLLGLASMIWFYFLPLALWWSIFSWNEVCFVEHKARALHTLRQQ